jgi:Uma2 family endonuclease
MSTITKEPRVSPLAPAETTRVRGEERVVALGVPWVIYDRLTDAMGEGSHIRIAYDGKDMEIMVAGPIHERRKELLSSFIEEVSVGLRINFQAFGQTTWKRSELERGLESDLCYYFDPAKLQAANDAAELDLSKVADYPNPDLAIEIDFSSPKIDRPGIYAALKVPEVWRLHDDEVTVTIEQLGLDGAYAAAPVSRFLRVRPADVLRWVIQEDASNRVNWTIRLRKWIRTDLRSRVDGA